MTVERQSIPEILRLTPKTFQDDRGFFLESFNQRVFARVTGADWAFVQDNHSKSARGVIRGLHYQVEQTQGKLVRAVVGRIFDVAVDLRETSPTFGGWVGAELSSANKAQLWIPPGFAHGFQVLSEDAEVLYKTTGYYNPAHERCIKWNDPDIHIRWPLKKPALVSKKDDAGLSFRDAQKF